MSKLLTWGVLALLLITLSALTLILITQDWPATPLVGITAGATIMAWLMARVDRAISGAERLTKLVQEAYRRDQTTLSLAQITEVTGEPRMQQAALEARARQQELWDSRYARGEQHDF
jgi:hypothetical protein